MTGRVVLLLLVASVIVFALALLMAAYVHDLARPLIWACGIGSLGLLVSAIAVAIAAKMSQEPRPR